ncbi:MAG: hypothetical protein LIR50_14035, partial [Bacillota bacterium]|nr:hypothetical protein [Bacillota bacterium]
INLPKGYYEVIEKSDWSWQYDQTLPSVVPVKVTFGMNEDGSRNIENVSAEASFTNESKSVNWLNSIDWVINKFAGGE